MSDVDYRGWALDMCSLLDAIEQAVRNGERDRCLTLVMGRFEMAKKRGLDVVKLGPASEGDH